MFRIIPKRAFIEPGVSIAAAEASETGASATIRIEGLLCSICAGRVHQRLEAVDGVERVEVDLERGQARVSYNPLRTRPRELAATVDRAILFRPARRLLARLAGSFQRESGPQERTEQP